VPDHPDQEQLAAYQAGDVDRRERLDVEAHLAACPACAELVASVARARGSLALLEEPALPPGLHDRLTAAVEAEAAMSGVVGERPGSGGLGEAGSEPRVLRPAPWYRRPAAWGAAAALLLAALVVPFLNQSAGDRTTAGGDRGGAAQEATAPAASASNLPVLRVQGEVTADTVRKRLQTDPQAKAALSGAATPQATDQDGTAFRSSARTSGTAPQPPSTAQPPVPAAEAPSTAQPAAPGAEAPSAGGQVRSPDPGTGAPPAAAPPPATSPKPPAAGAKPPATGLQAPAAGAQPAPGALQRQACLPAASADAHPAIRPLTPVFFIEGTYKGREATVLVTTSPGQPDRVDLWVFPRDDCTRVLATEQVR
jgi:Putative zinc-finger